MRDGSGAAGSVPIPVPPRRKTEKDNHIDKQNLLNINEKKIRDFRAEIARTRTFVWLPKIDMYVLREFMVPFSILIFAFTLLFMIADLFNDLGDFLDAHSPLVIGARYFLLKVPGNIRFVLPITVLLSCMYTIANFGRHRELTAMRASGISLMRSGLSIYVVAFLVMLVNYWFNETLIPQCMKEAELIITLATKGEAYVNEQSAKLQFHSTDKLRSWFIGQFSENGDQKDVKIKFFKADDTELLERKKIPVRFLQSKSARFIPEKGWEFDDYVITEYLEGLPSRIKRQPHGGPPMLLPRAEVPENPQMIEKKIVLPETLKTKELYTILKEDKEMAPSLRNVYATLFYYRLAFPWVCFLCSFLALPLASRNERSGIFTAIVTAVGVVAVYQVLTEIMMLAGKGGLLPPFVAGTFPTLAFMLYGWFFLIRRAG